MNMPERSFGRTVRYRRTKLGLSQAKLAELVGRTTPTIRSWERDKSRPNDPQVLAALAAILGIDENHLFDKAEVDRPEVENSPTVEQALATLSITEVDLIDLTFDDDGEDDDGEDDDGEDDDGHDDDGHDDDGHHDGADEPPGEDDQPERVVVDSEPEVTVAEPVTEAPAPEPDRERELVGAGAPVERPAYEAPPEPYQQTPLTPTIADPSYMEDNSQRQLYRVRTLATLVALVALVIAFIWAIGEGVGALDAWWDEFFGNLQL